MRPETARHPLGSVLWPTLETVIVANSFTDQGFLNRRRLSILRLLNPRLKHNRSFVRRCREGYEFFITNSLLRACSHSWSSVGLVPSEEA